jgi:hypothetical protein
MSYQRWIITGNLLNYDEITIKQVKYNAVIPMLTFNKNIIFNGCSVVL